MNRDEEELRRKRAGDICGWVRVERSVRREDEAQMDLEQKRPSKKQTGNGGAR
jgi:hypothetical protein